MAWPMTLWPKSPEEERRWLYELLTDIYEQSYFENLSASIGNNRYADLEDAVGRYKLNLPLVQE